MIFETIDDDIQRAKTLIHDARTKRWSKKLVDKCVRTLTEETDAPEQCAPIKLAQIVHDNAPMIAPHSTTKEIDFTNCSNFDPVRAYAEHFDISMQQLLDWATDGKHRLRITLHWI